MNCICIDCPFYDTPECASCLTDGDDQERYGRGEDEEREFDEESDEESEAK